MNNYTRKIKTVEAPRRGRSVQTRPWLLPMTLKLAVIGGLIFGAVIMRVSYSDKVEVLNRETVSIKMKIHRLNLEIANLKMQKERLSAWPVISSKICSYKLDLRPAEPRQVRNVALIGTSPSRRTADMARSGSVRRLELTQR